MTYTYNTSGTCSRQIMIDINDDNTLGDVKFLGGCNGNLKGIAALVKGQNIDAVIEKLEGIQCNMRPTSCPDQLAKALKKIKGEL
ncbi:MAG: TIGR03905 family TSCPD domain-containing protein [Clostridiales bacterium]|nr:TIGR03905 family TSCPD domain-containing protein [Clostridiales bacterium]